MIDKKSNFRVIVSKTSSAMENMAIDESLLLNFKENNLPILRIYSWEKDSLTIGVSQKFANYSFSDDFKGRYAKRITGGGVLFHGHDVSYSLVLPVELLGKLSIKESYEKICTFILDFYKKLGLKVSYAKDDENVQLAKSEFCQVGFEAYDILANGLKIGGNAQRRTKKAIFQHGSIPLYNVNKGNTFDDKYGTSLEDLDINISFEEIEKLLVEAFKDSFNVQIEYSDLTEDEIETKNRLLKEKYDYSRE